MNNLGEIRKGADTIVDELDKAYYRTITTIVLGASVGIVLAVIVWSVIFAVGV